MAAKDFVKWGIWRERLRRFRAGEWTVAEFCQREKLSAAVFYQWRRKLSDRIVEPGSGRVESQPVRALAEFVEVQITHPEVRREAALPTCESHVDQRVEIRLPNGACVLVSAHDLVALRVAIAAAGEFGIREATGGHAC
jgi:transposase-like protein